MMWTCMNWGNHLNTHLYSINEFGKPSRKSPFSTGCSHQGGKAHVPPCPRGAPPNTSRPGDSRRFEATASTESFLGLYLCSSNWYPQSRNSRNLKTKKQPKNKSAQSKKYESKTNTKKGNAKSRQKMDLSICIFLLSRFVFDGFLHFMCFLFACFFLFFCFFRRQKEKPK